MPLDSSAPVVVALGAVDLFVSLDIRLSNSVAPSMTGDLVEPNFEELGILESERLSSPPRFRALRLAIAISL
jgi:hypothetical protein